MVFSSFTFLFLFLPLVLIGSFLVPKKLSNLYLLIASYAFYGWGAPTIIPVLAGTTLFDYLISKYLVKDKLSSGKRETVLALGISLNLAFLLYFKYANFFVHELNEVLTSFGIDTFHWEEILLPIGISFFTFQKISYLVDVYRGTAPPAKSVTHYALYVALFPQLIAGPIVRYHEIERELHERAITKEKVYDGLIRFSLGLGKKVLIADFLGQVADKVFLLGPDELSTPFAWLGILCYTFQIYFDFSGYSDMAIGLGRIFGFTFPENFNNPYISASFREFWTRWHMTLSNWMKEYLYIPLGGNRVSNVRRIVNLWIVFLLSGFWHGASWNFIFWGIYHGFFMSVEKIFHNGKKNLFKVSLTFILVLFSWVLFRADNLEHAIYFYKSLLALNETEGAAPLVLGDFAQPRDLGMLFLAIGISFIPLIHKQELSTRRESYGLVSAISSYLILLLSLSALAGLAYTPFLYFRF